MTDLRPLDPGPLIYDDIYFSRIIALDLAGSKGERDDGMIAFMQDDRREWSRYAAWLVEASNAHRRRQRSQMDEFDYHMRKLKEWWFVACVSSAVVGAVGASFLWLAFR